MKEMSMGQRIAQERKKLGLSQEALGEKMGVSRQSISKWESGGATPEIEKLIALSKLFGVSVGWLLGVEELPQQETGLSENQLKLVGELAKQAQPVSHKSWWRTVAAAGMAVAVVLLSLGMVRQSQEIRSAEQAALLENQLSDISNRLSVLEAAVLNNKDTLLADYSLDVRPNGVTQYNESVARVAFTAVPNTWVSGDTGYLYVNGGNGEEIRRECTWDGTRLQSSVDLKVFHDYDPYELCFVVEHESGSQEQQILQNEGIDQLADNFTIPMYVEMGDVTYENGTLTLTDYTAWFDLPPIYDTYDSAGDEPGVRTCEYVLQCKPVNDTQYVSFTQNRINDIQLDLDGDYFYKISGKDIRFENIDIGEYDHMHLKFRVKFGNGMERTLSITTFMPDGKGGIE